MPDNTKSVLTLYTIKSKAVRRMVIALTILPLVLANLVAHVIAMVLLCWRNQVPLYRSARHYWNSSEKYIHEDSHD